MIDPNATAPAVAIIPVIAKPITSSMSVIPRRARIIGASPVVVGDTDTFARRMIRSASRS
jgi:hypothetical protein